MEQGESDGLLKFVVAVDLDIGPRPEVPQVVPLFLHQAVPACAARRRERRFDLVSHCGKRPRARPAVGDQLLDPQFLAGSQSGGDGQACDVRSALAAGSRPGGSVDGVVGRGRHAELAHASGVHQQETVAHRAVLLGLEGRLQDCRCAGITRDRRKLFVGDEFRLDDDAHRGVDGLHLVGDGRDRTLGEGDQPGGVHTHGGAGGRSPFAVAEQQAGPQVQCALVAVEPAVAQIEGFVADQQPEHLAVRDVDRRLTGLRIAVSSFWVRQGVRLVEPVEVRAGYPVRLALVEVAPPAEVAVGQGEHRLALRQQVQFER